MIIIHIISLAKENPFDSNVTEKMAQKENSPITPVVNDEYDML